MTRKEIMKRLGLKPFDEFEFDRFCELGREYENMKGVWPKQKFINDRYRQTGRTTRMLADVLGAATRGERVLVVFRTHEESRRALRVFLEMARKCDIDSTNSGSVDFLTPSQLDAFRCGIQNPCVFYDHHVNNNY